MSTAPTPETVAALLPEVAQLIVEALNLEVTADEIQPDAPLFGDGLGLDSIDVLEIALVISKRYGFQLRSDNADNTRIFASLRALTAHIASQRTQ
ncbi:phosphopantetheine-binding protein [Azonexus hydrophilus]|uniref:phosphopantetheine-binding protein n=1 Tax=Azonexus hydrophilus TaxID=418702 RepID=UPI0019659AEC|nr:phosphopantetheine-binding protein [Azonexus hydrophilus]